jgi:diaminohydroxyphosphoribosylaminopyrimidine deaminase / 5-amino-6-(5-phosphoribosylamino)uracil reductase
VQEHEKYMQRCFQLAASGLGHAAPNPLVGCVIVHNNKVIGEGYHQRYGEAHAEVNAVDAVKDKSLLSEATVYVSLEPCSHFGKTPPCADLLVKHKVKRVVISCTDPNPEVSGKGIEKLKSAGIEVIKGICEKEGQELNRRFFTFFLKQRPYVILKWAQSLNGYIDRERKPGDTGQFNISSDLSRMLVHKWRSEEPAILVGTRTALNDNPQLNVRLWSGKNPLRIVIDRSLRLPENLHLFDGSVQTLVFTEKEKEAEKNTEYIKTDFNNLPAQILYHLQQRKIQSLIIEGGAEILNTFIAAGLWDEARVFVSPGVVVEAGTAAPEIHGKVIHTENIAEDILKIYRNG